jgi:predicted dinucleotide-binding enzyme
MQIAIIGAGSVGSALAGAWTKKQHRVVFGTRHPSDEKVRALAARLGAGVASVADAVRGAEIVVLATPWNATREAVQSCGPLAGKTVVDCTNPLAPDLSGLTVGHTTSAGEQVAEWARGASVFKAFNQTGANNMGGEMRFEARPVMFVAGDDPGRKPAVLALADDAGFEAIDAGPITAARLLEPLAMLWIHLAYRQGLGREFAFAITRPAR